MPGPGEYVPDPTEGITRVEDLPKPRARQLSRDRPCRRCPRCRGRAGRHATATRTLHDLGDARTERPVELVVTFSRHRCPACAARLPSAFQIDCEDCGAELRPNELFGVPIRRNR